MFNLGFSEFTLIAVMALLLFGPDRLPEFARTVARFFKEFRRISAELQSTVHETVATIDSGAPRAPSLKEVYERIDPKRAIEEIGIRPFAAAAPGTVEAPPAVDAGGALAEVGLAMGGARKAADEGGATPSSDVAATAPDAGGGHAAPVEAVPVRVETGAGSPPATVPPHSEQAEVSNPSA